MIRLWYLRYFIIAGLIRIPVLCIGLCVLLLSSCSKEISQAKFAANDIEMTVTFKKIERHEEDDWVFARVTVRFYNQRNLLDLRCLRFSSGKYISSRVYVDSYISEFPTITADSNSAGSREFYWVVSKGIQESDLKNVKFSFIKEDPRHRTIHAKCD